jgi:hypothetical protein
MSIRESMYNVINTHAAIAHRIKGFFEDVRGWNRCETGVIWRMGDGERELDEGEEDGEDEAPWM